MTEHKLNKILSSQFEIDLLNAALKNLNEKSNKLRYNNFAYSIRELSRHFLNSLAPEANVKGCSWFKIETENGKPTRYQKIKYAIQGGINDNILEEWDFDVKELEATITGVVKTISKLSKLTHINPDVFDLSDHEIEENSKEVLSNFQTFVETIEEYRIKLKEFLDGHIEDQMINSIIYNSFESIDSLAPHYSLDSHYVSQYQISEINEYEIVVDVSGDINVTLEYGSRKERRDDDGLDLGESFPFETKIRYEISEDFPTGNYDIDDYGVDTSEWYK